jgi:pimeloyl-ACP methyl ester carboxylesterase
VIAYDRPGFGFTQRPTEWGQVNPYGFEGNFLLLDSIIEKYATSNQVILVGHSAGGQLAAEYARLNPNKVSGLVLVDPAILTTGQSPSWLNWILNIPQVDRIGPLLVKSISESGNDLLRQSFYDPESVTQEVFEGYNKVLQVKEWERAFWNFTKAPRDNDLVANLESVTQPILLITGERDTVVPTSDTVKLADIFPNSSLEIIKKSAHLPQEEQPQDFMTAIENHWEELVS